MPTRKQRRRREKDFRHDVRVVEVDAEGNEVPLAELRSSKERAPAKSKQQQKQLRNAKGRPLRVPPEPSWNRAVRRGGLVGRALLLALVGPFKSAPLPLRLACAVFYAAAF